MFRVFRPAYTVANSGIWHQRKWISTVKVEELFTRRAIRGTKVISSKNTDRIQECAKLMEKEKIGAVMVTDKANKVVGILTARDVQSAVASHRDISFVTAEDVMTRRENLATAKKSDNLSDVATVMMEKNIRHMPVMKGDECEGMLSIKDVVSEVLNAERREKQDLEDIVTDSYSHKSKTQSN